MKLDIFNLGDSFVNN